MSPKENFDFLNDYLKYFTPPIGKNNGFIDKFIGDAVLALFPHHPDDAVKAAIESLNGMKNFNELRMKSGIEPVRIGIGINAGNLMLGTIGDNERMDGTVISDAVNLASRLEGLTKTFGASIVISESTLYDIPDYDKYHSRFLGKVKVKGKESVVTVYEIFDGDEKEEIEAKINTKDSFESGLEYYFDKNFSKAVGKFGEVIAQNPTDKTAQIYLENSASYNRSGVPDDWEGIETLINK